MSRWFRLYADAMRDPKVGRLSDKDFRLWIELLSVAAENDGRIPPVDDLRIILKRRLDHLSSAVDRLISIGLIDCLSDGYAPHNWEKRQYKSDVSTARVRKHREKGNVSETPPDTDTDTDIPLAKANGRSPDSDKAFWDGAVAYLGGSKKRSLIGKWCRDFGKDQTAKAITAAQLERAVEPVSFIERTLRNGAKAPALAVEFSSPC